MPVIWSVKKNLELLLPFEFLTPPSKMECAYERKMFAESNKGSLLSAGQVTQWPVCNLFDSHNYGDSMAKRVMIYMINIELHYDLFAICFHTTTSAAKSYTLGLQIKPGLHNFPVLLSDK